MTAATLAAPVRDVVRPTPAALLPEVDGELSDDELEAVVGGLARVWQPALMSGPASAA